MKDGRKFTGEYPYKRMEWTFDELVVQLQRCLPRFPRGKAGLDELVAVAREADRLDSMQAIYEAARRA